MSANTGLNEKCALYRGRKSELENMNLVYMKYKVIVELPDDFPYDENSFSDLNNVFGVKFPYKMGDGEHAYCDLPYEPEKIPVAFII